MRPAIHLVNQFCNAFAGSERRALDYRALLTGDADVTLWAEEQPDAALAQLPVRRIDPATGDIPRGGTVVLVGVFAEREHWLAQARPERLVIVYNTPELYRLRRLLEFCTRAELPRAELIFPSNTHRASTNMAGFVDWGLYDFDAFKPAPRGAGSGSFIVGRLSRDEINKHHPQDIRVYRSLVQRGMRIRLMGATVLQNRLGGDEGIELLPAGTMVAERFLQSLDAFIYRTAPAWREASGRVIVEAMACAIPVVAGRNGGYRELIDHGRNGFLFDTGHEAVDYVDALRDDPPLAQRVGTAARATVVNRFGPAHRAGVREFLLRDRTA